MIDKMLLSGLLIIAVFAVFAFIPKNKSEKRNINTSIVTEQGIQFIEPDWSKALAEAKKQNKLIFLDAYASWCGPCKMLKRNTFPNKDAGEFFNKNFISIAIDMEKGDGPALGEKYRVNVYPTLIITDADGKIVAYTQGYISPKQLIDFGKHGLNKTKK
ncbi:thioredoxin fold domain-containing protein [Sediminibacterium sp.]|uniref:thioredoxin family protein n=1 Tax=Sediminibacterium sp. TaxID=1917865 RepID=UPI0025F31593|nr:thioredoxin fold domain-containing protein [Sediminibacterium sp.]MBT9484492.1 thioredoxin family protein [Sediminibacterium sp.]